MTIIVSVKINDGVVMAADSAATFQNGQIYLHMNKIANLVKGLPIGIMLTGAGGIGSESVETLFKDLRKRLTGLDKEHPDWKVDPDNYTISSVADRTLEMFSEKANAIEQPVSMLLRLCGYSSGRPLAEVWHIVINNAQSGSPMLVSACQVQNETEFGPLWNGETEAIDRLVFGLGGGYTQVAMDLGLNPEQAESTRKKLYSGMYESFWMNAMPVEDAIALAGFLVETTAGFVRFAVNRPKTVGGPTEVATITKHEGFRWVKRKHFYAAALNPESNSHPSSNGDSFAR